jgi:hypothetical protein
LARAKSPNLPEISMHSLNCKAACVFIVPAVLSITLFGSAATSFGGPLIAGGAPQLPVDTETQPSLPGATIVAGGSPVFFSNFGGSNTGALTSTVWANDPNNPYLATNPQAKTFTYLLKNDATSTNVLHRITVGSYSGAPEILTDAGYDSSTPGVAPTAADRSTADVIGFTFADTDPAFPVLLGNIPPGAQSKLLIVQTNATAFSPSFASVIDGGVTVIASWAPVQQIPEPGTCALASAGLVGLGIAIVRRRRLARR